MKSALKQALFLALSVTWIMPASAQFGYSPLIDSIACDVSLDSLSLFDRQLSGDTTVYIGGVLDSIKTRNSDYSGNAKAAQFILEEFQSFGLAAEYQQYDNNGYNVVATKTGLLFPNEHYVICAHYDDMPSSTLAPGADDNASGVSAVLEAARLLSTGTFDYTLKFVAFDEEEQGLIGSWAYADTAFKYGVVIKGVINLDMIGWDSNSDYELSVASNTTSMPLMESFTDILRIYQPELSPHLIIATNSDHSRFWNKGYQALLAIEEYPGDFLPYYHTVNDLFQNINTDFFFAVARGSIVALATMAKNYSMTMSHAPVASDRFTGDRNVNLVMTSPHGFGTGTNQPRLYYKIDEEDFAFVHPVQVSGDTFKFAVPGQSAGSKISYYFAAQDSGGNYCVTLPESGKGINPPGLVAPPVFYSYYVLNAATAEICATGLPLTIPANQTVFKYLTVPAAGRLLDINVKVSISHTNLKDINLYLVSPSGRKVMLSTKNGISLDNYTNTVFNDEASLFINQGRPPYTGSFRPEAPLSAFDDTSSNGNWSLKIVNAGGFQGSLTSFCLILTYAGGDYYVDASRPVSGNGRSWTTAFGTISEATQLEPSAGSVVFIKPGEYNEEINITSNGQEVVPLKTGVAISEQNKIQFPGGTDLSGIHLMSYPGEYYAIIYRSNSFNNGCYQVTQVNDATDFILVNTTELIDEEGIAGDSSRLSACVIRPVIYRKYSQNPDVERVIVDAAQDPEISTVLYIGEPVGDGAFDALPANYNIVDGIDLTGSANGGGIKLQSSSFNIVCNSRIYELNGAGILINGNGDHPAFYNIIAKNEIYNTPPEGIYIGAGEMPSFNNQTHFTHLLANNIFTQGSGDYARMENAIDIKENNIASVIQSNFIHDFTIITSDNGAVDINSGTDCTVLNANTLHDIGSAGPGTFSAIMVHDMIDSLNVFNNLIYNVSNDDTGVYAFRIDATGHLNSQVVHNTVYNVDHGFLLEDFGSEPVFGIHNNIIIINDQYFTNWGTEGRLQVSYNFYNEEPAPQSWMPYYEETGRRVGQVSFINPSAGDFHLTVLDDLLICNGIALQPALAYDMDMNHRDGELPDIGALELENKVVWTGAINQNWSQPGNWNTNSIPGSHSNAIIQPAPFGPVLDLEHVTLDGILFKPGSSLQIPAGKTLEQGN
jgi:subtilisin-like proprotein convertase family protein